MEEERKECMEQEEIVVLNKGIALEEMAGARSACCLGPHFPLRG